MPDMDTTAERLIDLARSQGLIRPCDLAPLGIPRVSLTRAVRRGQLERVGRGLYGLPGREVSAHGSLAEVARRVPKGVVCLLSALRKNIRRYQPDRKRDERRKQKNIIQITQNRYEIGDQINGG